MASGAVSGATAGVTSISYQLGNGCYSTRDIAVTSPASRAALSSGQESNQLFSVSPNPSNGVLTILASVEGIFNVYTVDGRKVAEYVVSANSTLITLPLELRTGIYMCRFDGRDGSREVVRLLIER